MAYDLFAVGDVVVVVDNQSLGTEGRKYLGQVGTVFHNDNLLSMSQMSREQQQREGGWWITVRFEDGQRVSLRLKDLVYADTMIEGKSKYRIRFLTGTRKKMSDRIQTYFESTEEEALAKAESLIISGKLRNVTKLRVEEGE